MGQAVGEKMQGESAGVDLCAMQGHHDPCLFFCEGPYRAVCMSPKLRVSEPGVVQSLQGPNAYNTGVGAFSEGLPKSSIARFKRE